MYRPIQFKSLSSRWALAICLALVAFLLLPALMVHADTITVDGTCDLYAAVENANNGDQTNPNCASGSSGHDTIVFDVILPGVVALDQGQLNLVGPLTIAGPGAGELAISGENASRVISTTGPVTITGVTIRSGNVAGFGGGIYNAGNLSLTDCAVTDNTISGADNSGAGIHNQEGILNVDRCIIARNTVAPDADDGGGIHTFSGTLTINNSYIYSNKAPDAGGGVRGNFATNISIRNSTVFSNTAANGGGVRIFNQASRMNILNSTITGNRALSGLGGGVFVRRATVTVTNSTVAGNFAARGGGGIATPTDDFAGVINLANTLVAANTVMTGGNDIAGLLTSLDYNLVGDMSGGSLVGMTDHDIVGQNPLLLALADNGGRTPTMALLSGSPAIDQIPAGENGCGDTIVADQRGVARPQGSACDIGAYEASETGGFLFLPLLRK